MKKSSARVAGCSEPRQQLHERRRWDEAISRTVGRGGPHSVFLWGARAGGWRAPARVTLDAAGER